jgi:undecaprenyl-diphosphatase
MMRYLTHLGGARATIAAGLALVAAGGEARAVGLAALLGNALSHIAVQILKRAVARPRPCDPWGRPLALVELPDPFSFPSGHAAAAFAVAVPVALTWGQMAPLALALAALVAASRVTLRVHHFSDVVAGAMLGVLGATVALQLLG